MTREVVLWQIAELYPQLVEPLNSGSGVRGSGDRLPMLDERLYTPTVREFERLLRLMRDDRNESLVRLETGEKASVRRLRWHLVEWHLHAQVVLAWPKPKVTANQPRKLRRLPVDELDKRPLPQKRVLRHPEARERLARAAVVWMAERWALQTEPMLPAAVVEPVRAAA